MKPKKMSRTKILKGLDHIEEMFANSYEGFDIDGKDYEHCVFLMHKMRSMIEAHDLYDLSVEYEEFYEAREKALWVGK
jgi:hypothetical protein